MWHIWKMYIENFNVNRIFLIWISKLNIENSMFNNKECWMLNVENVKWKFDK